MTTPQSPLLSPKKKLVTTPTAFQDPGVVAKAEKGWISSAIKSNSHNHHLNKLQKKSEEALLVI